MIQNLQALELSNPSLTIYTFHLRDGIGNGFQNPLPEASQIWEQLIKLGQVLHISKLKKLTSELICYEEEQYCPEAEDRKRTDQFSLLRNKDTRLDFQFLSQPELQITGFLSPFRYHDTYFIDLTISSKNKIKPTQLTNFNPQYQLLSPHLQASLGQTLFFYAELTTLSDNCSDLADACVQQLLPEKESVELVDEGRLFDCPIFIYDNGKTDPTLQRYLIIWFNPNSTVLEQLNKEDEKLFYESLTYLLWSRHKILYAYSQSRWCYEKIKPLYTEIEEHIKDFGCTIQAEGRLEELKYLLGKLPETSLIYGQQVREIEDHKNTIKENIRNYINLTKKIKQLSKSDLAFLKQFSGLANNRLIPQIESDLSLLRPVQPLFQELLSSIRSIVAIDQVESDRQFLRDLQQKEEDLQEEFRKQDIKDQNRERRLQIVIFAAGGGVTLGGIVASSSGQVTSDNPIYFPGQPKASLLSPHPFTWFVIFSIILGILGAGIAAVITILFQKCFPPVELEYFLVSEGSAHKVNDYRKVINEYSGKGSVLCYALNAQDAVRMAKLYNDGLLEDDNVMESDGPLVCLCDH